MLAEKVGSLFKSHPRVQPEIREGEVYRHKGTGGVVETAKVLHVGPDPMGIPHVRFRVVVGGDKEHLSEFEASRTLNIESFVSHFTEAVET